MLSALEEKESREDREHCSGREVGFTRKIREAHAEVSFHLRLKGDEGMSILGCWVVVT